MVECRDDGDEAWEKVMVTALIPLSVSVELATGAEWDSVRAPAEAFAVGEVK